MSYGISGYTYGSSSSTPSKTSRCTNDYKASQMGLIDASKLDNFEVNVSEINDIYKKIAEADRIVKLANNRIRTYSSEISGTSKESKKMKLMSKKQKFESSRRIKDDERRNLTKKAYSLISQQIKSKAIARINRLTNDPTEERLTKTACTLRALLQTLESNNCAITQSSSGGTFKPTRESELINQFTQRMNKEYPDYEDLARAYIRSILENKKNGAIIIKHIQMIDGAFAKVLISMIESITTCSA